MMTNERVAQLRSAIPWSAVIAAVAFGWSAVGQLVSVRDDILSHCHAVELRVSNMEAWRSMHDARDTQIYAELVGLIKQMKDGS